MDTDASRPHESSEERERRMHFERAIAEMDALRARIEERNGGPLDESWPIIREFRDR